MTSEDDAEKGPTEVLAFKLEMRLVPEWSGVLERICRHHGDRVAVAVEEDQLVVRAEVQLQNKPGMMRDIERFWAEYTTVQKRDGSWRP